MDKLIVNKSRMRFPAGAAETSPAINGIFTIRSLDPQNFIDSWHKLRNYYIIETRGDING